MKAVDPETHYPIVSLHRQMFLWSALLLVTTVWMFWADYNREWKKYQRDFLEKEHQKAVDARAEAARKLDPEFQKAEEELKAAENALKAKQDEIASLEKEIDAQEALRFRKNQEYLDADQQVKSAKYFWDEAEHAVSAGHESQAAAEARRETYEAWVETLASLKVEVERAEAAKGAAEDKRKAIERPVLDLRERIEGLQLQVSKLDKRLKDTDNAYWANRVRRIPFVEMLNPDIKIRQVLIDSLSDDYYFAKPTHVDRCHTCHLAIDRKGYEDEANPLKTHPRLDLYVAADSKHPLEQFGCTACHSGSGRSCTFTTSSHTPPALTGEKEAVAARWEKDYRWHEMHHWDDPQLPKDLLAASCWKCHKQEGELEGAGPWNEGRKVFERSGCFACHRTQGFETARRPGPTLYHIADKTTKEWAFHWVLDPPSVRPETRMPRSFGVNPGKDDARDRAEAQALVEFLFAASEPLGDPAPPIAQDQANVANGQRLVESVGCLACHSVEGRPAGTFAFNADLMSEKQRAAAPGVTYQTTFGPVLAGVGSKTTYAWLWRWVKDPRHSFRETRMPNLRLADGEAADIAAYLMTLKAERDLSAPAPETKGIHDAAWEYLRAKHSILEVGERDKAPTTSYSETLAQDFFASQVTGAVSEADVEIGDAISGQPVDRMRGRISLMSAAGLWKDAAVRFEEVVTKPLSADLKDDAAMAKLRPALDRAKGILAGWSERLLAASVEEREKLYLGERMVNRYGCFSCHAIRGYEKTTPIGRDFTGQDAIGGKDLVQIDFGFTIKDGDVHRDRWEWMDLKIRDPRIFDRGYDKHGDERLRMPRFSLSDEERHKLIVFLASLVKTEVPLSMQKRLDEREAALERGRWLVREKNCAACHRFTLDKLFVEHLDEETQKKSPVVLEGTNNGIDPDDQSLSFAVWKKEPITGCDPDSERSKYVAEAEQKPRVVAGLGGDIVEVLLPRVMKAEGVENPVQARVKVRDVSPPILVGEGKKVRPEWLFGFLKEPVTLRGFLEIRMPTFGLTDDEATDLARWFSIRDGERFPYESVPEALPVESTDVKMGKRIFDAKGIECISCHVVTGKPGSGGTTKAPDLDSSKDRLKVEWMKEWLRNPAALQPGTRMPKFHWGNLGIEGLEGDPETQIRQVVEYLRRLETK